MGNKLSEPIKVGNLTFKNRIMFPPLTTGYEERDGSIGARSLNFYERLAKGGAAYVVIGDVAPVRTASPTPKLYDDSQVFIYRNLAVIIKLHRHQSFMMTARFLYIKTWQTHYISMTVSLHFSCFIRSMMFRVSDA